MGWGDYVSPLTGQSFGSRFSTVPYQPPRPRPVFDSSTHQVGTEGRPFPQRIEAPWLPTVLSHMGTGAGYVAERPLAWVNALGPQNAEGKGLADQAGDFIKSVPVFGPLVDGLAKFVETDWIAKIVNSQTAGWLRATASLPDSALAFESGGMKVTVGEARRAAFSRGWSQQDIEDLRSGRKSEWDFEGPQYRMVDNELADIGLRMLLHPANLALGAGAAAKALRVPSIIGRLFPKGVQQGFDAFQAGRVLASSVKGEQLRRVPLSGVSGFLVHVGRGTQRTWNGYLRASVGLTGVELGIEGLSHLDPATRDNTPVNGMLEPLYDFGKRMQENKPLSQNHLFSLYAAFKFPFRAGLRELGVTKGKTSRSLFGDDWVPRLVNTLEPGPKSTEAARTTKTFARLGGEQAAYDLLFHLASRRVWRKVAPFLLSEERLASLTPESMRILAAHIEDNAALVEGVVEREIARGAIKGRDLMEEWLSWTRNEKVVDELSGGLENVGATFDDAVRVWNEWRPLAARLSELQGANGPVVVGVLRDSLPAERLAHIRTMFRYLADENGAISRDDMARVVDRFPQLMREEPYRTYFGKYLVPDGPQAKLRSVEARLRNMEKDAPTLRQLFADDVAWENAVNAGAGRPRPSPFRADGSVDRDFAPGVSGDAEIFASRMRPSIAEELGIESVSPKDLPALREQPTVAAWERAIGPALDYAGYNVRHVTQSIGGWARDVEPSTITRLASTTPVEDVRQVAALLAKTGDQDATFLVYSGMAAVRRHGLTPNAREYRLNVGATTPEQRSKIIGLLADAFSDGRLEVPGWTFQEATGAIRVVVREGSPDDALVRELGKALQDELTELMGAPVALQRRRAYAELVINDRGGAAEAGAGEVLVRDIVERAGTDPRFRGGETYLQVEGTPRGARPSGGPDAGRVEVLGLPGDARGVRGGADQLRPERPGDLGRGRRGRKRRGLESDASPLKAAEDAYVALQTAAPEEAGPLWDRIQRSVDDYIDQVAHSVNPLDAPESLRLAAAARPGARISNVVTRHGEDLVRSGGDTDYVLYMAQRDAAVTDALALPRFDSTSGIGKLPEEVQQELAAFERQLKVVNPAYTLRFAPEEAVPFRPGQGQVMREMMKTRTALGRWLFDYGLGSKMDRFAHFLFSPVKNLALARDAKQALYNELLPAGATVKEVNQFAKRLEDEADRWTLGKTLHVRAFRSGDALWASKINSIAVQTFRQSVIDEIGADQFYLFVDRAASRFYRTLNERGKKGGRKGQLYRALEQTYRGVQHTPAGSAMHGLKWWYTWFRFLLDPRWHAMNLLEADIIGLSRYGVRNRFASKAPTHPFLLHADRKGRVAQEVALMKDAMATGWHDSRALGGVMSRAFEREMQKLTQATLKDEFAITESVLNALPEIDPITNLMVRRFGKTEESWSKGLNDMLYAWDTVGPQEFVLTAAAKEFTAEEIQQLRPLLQRLWERHEEAYQTIVSTFMGNASRSNIERLANSYFVYWPISYQLKATKWLFDVMTQGFAGRRTNLGGAWEFSELMELHAEKMVNDPQYARTFEEFPETWRFVGMFLPITPFDMGVALSPFTRHGLALLPEDVRPWEPVERYSTLIGFMARVMTMGPGFTVDVLERIAREHNE